MVALVRRPALVPSKLRDDGTLVVAHGGELGDGIVSRAYRLLAGCIPVVGLALQFWLMVDYPSSKGLLTTATRFFSFFTIQTNLFIAACMLLDLSPVWSLT
jgi:hypothetical protein